MSDQSLSEPAQHTPQREIYSVSGLNYAVRDLLEGEFPLIWVEGEISNLACPSSGHIYFSLKDEAAQVRCAMFKMRNRLLNFQPANGQHVLVRAKVSLYPARGDYQLIAEHIEEAGAGALQRQFELLKQRLSAEGLFDAAHKQALPAMPTRLGVITSPTGAAIRDILSVLKRRFPGLPILIYPVPVQGNEAPAAIVEAIRTAEKRRDCDLLILARGGGSMEDLWAFNDEAVARAIFDCTLPVVSGIGHEVDVTIADFVADVRAPTPSAAAELVSPNREEWLEVFENQKRHLARAWQAYIANLKTTLGWLQKHIKHPGQRLREQAQRLDELEQRLLFVQQGNMKQGQTSLNGLQARLQSQSPSRLVRELKLQLANLLHGQQQAMRNRLNKEQQHLITLSRALEAVSPLATLNRGYAIVQSSEGEVLRQASEVAIGDQVTARLSQGRLVCRVEAHHKD